MAGHVAIQDIEAFNVLGRTEKAIKAGDTTFQVRGSIASFNAGAVVTVDVLGSAEVRTVSSVDGRIITVSSGFSSAHEPGVVWQRSDVITRLHDLVVTGDVTVQGTLYAGGALNVVGNVLIGGALTPAGLVDPVTMTEQVSDPAAPDANNGVIYMKDNGSGKTQLCVRFSSGAVQVLATQP